MKSLNVTLLIFALIIFSCKKDNVTPATANNGTSSDLGQWIKTTQQLIYAADGVTIADEFDTNYDSQGRTVGLTDYQNGVVYYQTTNYNYNGNVCTFTANNYTNGNLTSSVKAQTTYFNN